MTATITMTVTATVTERCRNVQKSADKCRKQKGTERYRQVQKSAEKYTYGRFWKTNKLVLLYPGLAFDSGYLPYPNKNDHDYDYHQCKTLFVNILEGDKIDNNLAFKIIQHLNN